MECIKGRRGKVLLGGGVWRKVLLGGRVMRKVLRGGGGRWKEGAGHVSVASWPGVGRSWARSLITDIKQTYSTWTEIEIYNFEHRANYDLDWRGFTPATPVTGGQHF